MKENELKYALQYSYIIEKNGKYEVKNHFEYFDKHNSIYLNRVDAINTLNTFVNIIKEENNIIENDNNLVHEKLKEVIDFDKYYNDNLFKNNFRKLGLGIALLINDPDEYIDDELREIIYIDGFGFDIPIDDYDKAILLEIELMYYDKYHYKANTEDIIECKIEDPGDLAISEFKFLKNSLVNWTEYEKNINNEIDISTIINSGEGQTIEFKYSFLFNNKYKSEDNNIKYTICKTIAGFANRNGGIILIGINDKGQIIGLEESDFQIVSKDQLLNKIDSQIHFCFSKEIYTIININYKEIDSKTILSIEINASLKPVFIKNKEGIKEFYVRTTQGIEYYDLESAIKYCIERFN